MQQKNKYPEDSASDYFKHVDCLSKILAIVRLLQKKALISWKYF